MRASRAAYVQQVPLAAARTGSISPYPAPMRWLRDVAYLIAVALGSPVWVWRMYRAGKLRTDWRARFGHGTPLPKVGHPRVLIHAVSVGEVNAIRLLTERLRAGSADVVVSVTTDTGIARAREVFAGKHAVVRYPFDPSWMVRRFLDRVQPDLVALTELELWPNFVDECKRRRIPVVVINGRLSARSFGRYRRVRPLLARTFAAVRAVLAQNAEYAQRFVALGTPEGRVVVTGTMKWDTAQIADRVPGSDELAAEMGIDRKKPLIAAGSTAPEEHSLLHRATPEGTQLLCAPRKPEWFNDAAMVLGGCARRSLKNRGSSSNRYLLDTIGELRKAYALADVVVIGRTFGALYGSDMMEPAGLGKAIVCGPRVADFKDTANALLAAGAMVQTDAAGLPAALERLVKSPEERQHLGERARAVVRAQQGATEKTAEALLWLVSHGGAKASAADSDGTPWTQAKAPARAEAQSHA